MPDRSEDESMTACSRSSGSLRSYSFASPDHCGAIELVEVLHAIFHRRLIGADFVAALRIQRACRPASMRSRDFVVLVRRLHIGGLLGFDKLALEQGDLFRIVKLARY